VVRAHLAKLDAAAAAALDPFVPQPMSEDESLQSFCKFENDYNRKQAAEEDKELDAGAAKMTCSCSQKAIEKGSAKPKPPYLDVRIIKSRCERGNHSFENVFLALKLAAGWFTEQIASVEQTHYCWQDFNPGSLEVSDVVPGGAPEILVRWTEEGGCRSGEASSSTHLRVAGLGPSGKPSITPTIDLGEESSGGDDEEIAKVLEAGFDQGQLVIKNKKGARKDPSLGAHTLVFP
jgi:hypothetical protein